MRLFRQSAITQQTSLTAWDKALKRLDNSINEEKQEKIKQLLKSWAELDEENEQQETLKIIESLENVSI